MRPGLLLHPAEGGDVVVGAEQQPGLRRAGLAERSVSHSESVCDPERQPACHLRRVAVAHRALQHRPREPVDLQVDDAGDVGHLPPLGAPRDALRHAQGVDVVVVGAQEHLEHHGDGGGHQRDEQRPEEPVHLEGVVGEVRRDQDHPRVQHAARAGSPTASMYGRRSAAISGGSTALRMAINAAATNAPEEPLDLDAGHDHRGDVQRERAGHPLQEQPPRAGSWACPATSAGSRRTLASTCATSIPLLDVPDDASVDRRRAGGPDQSLRSSRRLGKYSRSTSTTMRSNRSANSSSLHGLQVRAPQDPLSAPTSRSAWRQSTR